MSEPQMISFARGAPSLDIVDIPGLRAAAERAFDTDPGAVAGYGPGAGYPPLREWIAARRGVAADEVLLTNGSFQGDSFIFDHLLTPGDEVVVESPTYDRTLLNLQRRGVKIHQIPLDADGLVVDELRERLESGARPRLAHIIPNFQNPAGVTLSLQRRRALLELAHAYQFMVFEDDPYQEIRFRGEALPSMMRLDRDAAGTAGAAGTRVVHASSFTKTVCPGVRVGYLIGSASLAAELTARAVSTYISPNMLAEVTVHQFCVSGALDRSVVRVREVLRRRASLLAGAVREHIPGSSFREPDGGYFLWVQLPGDIHVDALVPAATRRGVAVVRGSDFLLDGGTSALRLAFSAVADAEIEEGVRRLALAVADVRAAT